MEYRRTISGFVTPIQRTQQPTLTARRVITAAVFVGIIAMLAIGRVAFAAALFIVWYGWTLMYAAGRKTPAMPTVRPSVAELEARMDVARRRLARAYQETHTTNALARGVAMSAVDDLRGTIAALQAELAEARREESEDRERFDFADQ
jgi:hypothetical protein